MQFFWTSARPNSIDAPPPTNFRYGAGAANIVYHRGDTEEIAFVNPAKECVEYKRRAGEAEGRLQHLSCLLDCPVLCCSEREWLNV